MFNSKEYHKAWYEAHKEEQNAKSKAYYQEHKEEYNEYSKAYHKANLNSLGQTKNNVRRKSRYVLERMKLHIDGYEVHHCFGYEDPNKFIYISKSLHLKIHKFLRENNIPADSNHWLAIRELVNNADEFTYIKC